MKKIALILVLALCCGLLAGCMGQVTTTPTENGVTAIAELTVDGKDTIVIGVDKDEKVLTVSYGFTPDTSSTAAKSETVFKDLSITGKTFADALDDIIGVLNPDQKLSFKVKAAKDGKGDAVVSGSDALIETMIERINAAIAKLGAKQVEVSKVDADGNEEKQESGKPTGGSGSEEPTASTASTASDKPNVNYGDNVIIDDFD